MGIRSGDYWDHGTSKAVQFMVPLGEFNLYNRISNIIALGGKIKEKDGEDWNGERERRQKMGGSKKRKMP